MPYEILIETLIHTHIMKVDTEKFTPWNYESDTNATSQFAVGDVVAYNRNNTIEIGVVLAIYDHQEIRTDSDGNIDESLLSLATLEQIETYRPSLLLRNGYEWVYIKGKRKSCQAKNALYKVLKHPNFNEAIKTEFISFKIIQYDNTKEYERKVFVY